MEVIAPEPDWRVLDRTVLCQSDHLSVGREQIATPSRPQGIEWMVVRRRQAAVIAPRTPEGNFLLIRQERVAVQRTLWEFPAGQVDEEVVDIATLVATARRELREEAGVECPGELTPLRFFYPSPGFTDECSHLFLAPDVVPHVAGRQPDAEETILEVGEFSAPTLRAMIGDGVICDANTLALTARLMAGGLWV